jgi:hypothetical protein
MKKKNDAKYQSLHGSEQDDQINPIEGEIHNRDLVMIQFGMSDKNR